MAAGVAAASVATLALCGGTARMPIVATKRIFFVWRREVGKVGLVTLSVSGQIHSRHNYRPPT